MKISDFIKKIFRKNEIKQMSEPKDFINTRGWRDDLQCEINSENLIHPLTLEQMRMEQIKLANFLVLFREGHLMKEDIIESIQMKYPNIVLDNAEMEALIAIHDVMQYEDLYADYNIREFIDEDKNNIVELVDRILENAKEEAKKYNSENVSEFITRDKKVINKIKNQIKENKSIEEENNK